MNIDTSKITDVKIDGIKMWDYPDFCDAYIVSGLLEISREEYNLCKGNNQIEKDNKFFRDLTVDEINFVNNNLFDFIHQKVWETLN